MKHVYSDGGRSKYFRAENVGDCVTRAICNASGKDYFEVYSDLKRLARDERITKRHKTKSTVRNGVSIKTVHKYLEEELKWKWHSCCGIGKTMRTHLTESELPGGILICQVSKHLTCVKDRVLYDTYDCTRDGSRMVYGYWTKE